MRKLSLGSRGSQLALRQTNWVVERLQALDKTLSVEVKVIKTTGDRMRHVSFAGLADRGVFVREIELALISGQIDLAVHSAKDLPSDLDGRLIIAAYPEREEPADVLISRAGSTLAELPQGASVGTSSVRRRAQLLYVRPDLKMVDLRGNLDTRLAKLDGGQCDAIVLAAAGLNRLGWSSRTTESLSYTTMLPAIGQGALAIQCRRDDAETESVLSALDHGETRACVTAERSLSENLHAGCQTPVAALARMQQDSIHLDALVASLDGRKVVRHSVSGRASAPEALGREAADWLLNSEARILLEEARRDSGPAAMGAA